MESKEKNVRLGGKIVDTAIVPRYATVDEMIENEEDANILSSFHKGNDIRIMGNARQKHAPKSAGKNKRFWVGVNLLTETELIQFQGNAEGLKSHVATPEVQARIDAALAEEEGE